jgi:hypothetical protein
MNIRLTEAQALLEGFERVKTDLSKYKFTGTTVYRKGDAEIAFYSDEIMEQYPHLKAHNGHR